MGSAAKRTRAPKIFVLDMTVLKKSIFKLMVTFKQGVFAENNLFSRSESLDLLTAWAEQFHLNSLGCRLASILSLRIFP